MTNEEILNAIAEMSVLELSELVKAIEDKFGVSAAAPVAVAAACVVGGQLRQQLLKKKNLNSTLSSKKLALRRSRSSKPFVKSPASA